MFEHIKEGDERQTTNVAGQDSAGAHRGLSGSVSDLHRMAGYVSLRLRGDKW